MIPCVRSDNDAMTCIPERRPDFESEQVGIVPNLTTRGSGDKRGEEVYGKE